MNVDAGESLQFPITRHGTAVPATSADAYADNIEALFRRCERRLGKYLVQLIADRALAEDLLQDTFHDAFRSRHQLQDVTSPDAWLFGIARNRALAALRRRRRFHVALTRLARRPSAIEADAEIVAVRDLLQRHLAPEDRSLLILRYLHGFDAAELGELTGRSAEAVRQRLARARAKLLAASADPEPRDQEV